MSIISHLHQLFNEETCQTYLHKLRWKDRPLQCPHCESEDIRPWGVYHRRPGLKRHRCKNKTCGRTFNDLTLTTLSHSKLSLHHWILATNMMVSILLVASNRSGVRRSWTHWLSMVLVVAECSDLL